MKKWWVLLLAFTLGVVVAAGCATPTSTPTATPSPTSTPMVSKEWNLEGIQVYGSTIAVSLHMYAGVDVWVTLDGRPADEIRPTLPTIEYLFNNVDLGTHTVEVRDVVGYSETAEAVLSTAPPLLPWQADLIHRLEIEPVTNTPTTLIQYGYKGQVVYYVPPRCCDIFSDLYDADGNVIGHPDGGITGQGDGRVPDFLVERENERIVWKDQRTYDSGLVQVPAPIESVEVLILESFPVQYQVIVVSGLPNACYSFAGYRLERSGDTIHIVAINWKPADPSMACAEVYGTVDTTIHLGSDFESGKTYTIVVNEVIVTLIAQ